MTANVSYCKNRRRYFGFCELDIEQLSEWYCRCTDHGMLVVPVGNGEPSVMFKTEFLYAVSSAMYAEGGGGFKWVITLWTPTPERAEPMILSLLHRLTNLPCGEEVFDDGFINRYRRVEGCGPEPEEELEDDG